jgi:hypothetical protein
MPAYFAIDGTDSMGCVIAPLCGAALPPGGTQQAGMLERPRVLVMVKSFGRQVHKYVPVRGKLHPGDKSDG